MSLRIVGRPFKSNKVCERQMFLFSLGAFLAILDFFELSDAANAQLGKLQHALDRARNSRFSNWFYSNYLKLAYLMMGLLLLGVFYVWVRFGSFADIEAEDLYTLEIVAGWILSVPAWMISMILPVLFLIFIAMVLVGLLADLFNLLGKPRKGIVGSVGLLLLAFEGLSKLG